MKFLFPTPVAYDGDDARFLQRDGARFARECAERGHAGVKIILDGGPARGRPASPLLQTAPWGDWRDPSFWRRQRADGVLLYGGYDRRMPPVARAIREAGVPLALKMDDAIGLVRFPRNASAFFWRNYWKGRQRHCAPRALAAAAARLAVWPLRPRTGFLTSYLELFDAIFGESRLCVENTRDFLLRARRPDIAARLDVMPHPVLNDFTYGPDCEPKRNEVLAVAMNWRDPLKRGRLLGGALGRFLANNPDWSAKVIGNGGDLVRDAAGRARDRVSAIPALPPEALLPHYRGAKILAMPSGAESFPIVVMEALCCGCSAVFPPELPALAEFVSDHSATQAPSATPRGLASALDAERRAWAEGRRDPVASARRHGDHCHVRPLMGKLADRLTRNPEKP